MIYGRGRWSHSNLDFWMVGSYAESHKPVWHWERLVHVDFGIVELAENPVSCVESCGACTDHGEAKGTIPSVRG